MGSGRGKGQGARHWERGLFWETQVPRLRMEGKWELGANTQGRREGMSEEETAGALIPCIPPHPAPPNPAGGPVGWARGRWGH